MTNEDTTDFDEHFAKISSYIVDTLHGVPLEMTEDEKEQFRIQVISNQYAERLLSEAEKTETYRGLSKIDILHTVSIPQLARTIPLKGLNLSLEKYRMPDGVIIEVESSSHYLGSFSEKNDSTTLPYHKVTSDNMPSVLYNPENLHYLNKETVHTEREGKWRSPEIQMKKHPR